MAKIFLGSIVGLLVAFSATAQPNPSSLVDAKLKKEIQDVITNPLVVDSIKNQNKRLAGITQDQVDMLDKQWRQQREAEDQYMIAAVLSNPLSTYLTRVQAHAGGKFLEIFMMDDKGLNVGQSDISSDYWQGDEGKWQKTFLKGADTVFLDDAEYNNKNKVWAAQYNVTVVDENNQPIGAATFELNLTELARRQQQGE